MSAKNHKAVLFSLDVLTNQKSERESLDISLSLPPSTSCPILSRALKQEEILAVAERVVLIYNAIVEQALNGDSRPPNMNMLVERALKPMLKREPYFEETQEVIGLIAEEVYKNMSISEKYKKIIELLYATGHMLGIVANLPIPASFLMDFLIKSGLRGYFETIITSNDMGIFKPSQEIFKHAINSMGINERNVVIIGSNYDRDIQPLHDIVATKVFISKRAKTRQLPTHIKKIQAIEEIRNFV
ncbi:MAG: HAD hydrolase-like protein [Chloroherpetonaceae bacterium]|nr:HAD hydrolase-like protein [Chloroherpetonaceae bacterium]MDW8438302.1 HAD family hydrolase [Chloroherpetonaceae bacterium]